MKEDSPKIVVLGSINMDLVIQCADFPTPGQTVLANSSREFCGGKGANQAVAASRVGGDVTMVGAVGDDVFANRLLGNLKDHSIDRKHILPRANQASGVAVITVDAKGENSIIVVSGANATVTPEEVDSKASLIQSADVLLVQLEIPIESVARGIELARESGTQVIFDPAPAPASLPQEMIKVDLMCPNESEAAALTGLPVESVDDAKVAAQRLHEMGAKNVALTLGDKGTLLFDGSDPELIPPFVVDVVDTTGAGDAFAGALAVWWSKTDDLRAAIRYANAAGALAASKAGAQASMASEEEIETLMRNQS